MRGFRFFGDFQRLSDGQGAKQQVESVAAGFAVLVEDDERGEEAEGDAEKRGAVAEAAAHRGEKNQERSAHSDRRIEPQRKIAQSEDVRPRPCGQIEERHAGPAEAWDGVQQVQERGIPQLGDGEDLVPPHGFAQRPQDAGRKQRADAEERENPAEKRAGGLLLPHSS